MTGAAEAYKVPFVLAQSCFKLMTFQLLRCKEFVKRNTHDKCGDCETDISACRKSQSTVLIAERCSGPETSQLGGIITPLSGTEALSPVRQL